VPRIRHIAAAVLTLAALARPAAAEVNEVRFARNVGLGYLPLYVMEVEKLVEKQAAKAGLGEIRAGYRPVGGPGPINDTLLSGNAEYGAAGIQGMIIAWDKTRGGIDIKGLAALSSVALTLTSSNPAIRRIEDFTDQDRIALPTVGVSTQAYMLQRAAERIYGPGNHAHFDKLTVSLSHPNGVAAMLAPKSEITAHFTTPPYDSIELQDPRIHKVADDGQLLGIRSSSMSIWTTRAFYQANPKVNQAVLAALDEAVALIRSNPKQAAADFIAIEGSGGGLTEGLVEKILSSGDAAYDTTPQGVLDWALFMQRTGTIRNRPGAWTDLFFDAVWAKPGS
jgi:NitT/TauT family transport system substrate-binding protein